MANLERQRFEIHTQVGSDNKLEEDATTRALIDAARDKLEVDDPRVLQSVAANREWYRDHPDHMRTFKKPGDRVIQYTANIRQYTPKGEVDTDRTIMQRKREVLIRPLPQIGRLGRVKEFAQRHLNLLKHKFMPVAQYPMQEEETQTESQSAS